MIKSVANIYRPTLEQKNRENGGTGWSPSEPIRRGCWCSSSEFLKIIKNQKEMIVKVLGGSWQESVLAHRCIMVTQI